MRMRLLAAIVVVLSLGCSGGDTETKSNPASAEGNSFHSRFLEIARNYEDYGRYDEKLRFAPEFCADAGRPGLPRFRFSASEDSATHGRKLYSLFVKVVSPRVDYTTPGKPNPVGQTIVKEAWLSEEVSSDTPQNRVVHQGRAWEEREDAFIPFVRKNGRLYHATIRSSLFIMYKLDPKTPDTDEGWVYGTVTADGKTVTSAGKVRTCMDCHKDAPHDRLFGVQKD